MFMFIFSFFFFLLLLPLLLPTCLLEEQIYSAYISNKVFGGGAAGAEIDSLSLGLSLSLF
jgi:hypothetical protein